MRRTVHDQKFVRSSTLKLLSWSSVRICPWDGRSKPKFRSVVHMDGWTGGRSADDRLRPWRPGGIVKLKLFDRPLKATESNLQYLLHVKFRKFSVFCKFLKGAELARFLTADWVTWESPASIRHSHYPAAPGTGGNLKWPKKYVKYISYILHLMAYDMHFFQMSPSLFSVWNYHFWPHFSQKTYGQGILKGSVVIVSKNL